MTRKSRLGAIVLVSLALACVVFPWASAGEPKAGGKKPATEKDRAGWKALFDGKTLANWKATNFGGEGEVSVKEGAVVMEQGNDMTGITYQGKDFPRMDYEVVLEGKKIKGSDFFCTTTFPVGDTFCSFVTGGWGGTVVGLSSVNALDAVENETTKIMDFNKNQWYRVRIRVTKEKIEAWIDNEQMVEMETKDKKITLRAECDPCKPFGVATWRTEGAVRDIRVRMLTDAEKKPAEKKK
jgi:hypothetical protein